MGLGEGDGNYLANVNKARPRAPNPVTHKTRRIIKITAIRFIETLLI
jgi:hypothetical protein